MADGHTFKFYPWLMAIERNCIPVSGYSVMKLCGIPSSFMDVIVLRVYQNLLKESGSGTHTSLVCDMIFRKLKASVW